MLTAPAAPSVASRHQVFISYSRLPDENAAFVRDLAGRLRVAGFNTWLDEEQLWAGTDAQASTTEAITESEMALFVVTARWFEREWTQHEVKLFGEGNEGARRIVVLREEVDRDLLSLLGPYLSRVQRVSWLANDPQPHARFWEVFCGLTGREPGPRSLWEKEGRRASRQPALERPAPVVEPSEPGRISLACEDKPVACVTGERWTFVVTDSGEWVGVSPSGSLHPPLERLARHSAAAVSMAGELLVGMYEPTIARLRGERWEYLPQAAPVLCFGRCAAGDLAGTTAGGVVLLDAGTSVSALASIRDPVVALAGGEECLLVLGSRGMFGRASMPLARDTALQWIETGALGRPLGFFSAVESGDVGLMGATRVGVLDPMSGRMTLCPWSFDEGVRDVVFLGAGSRPYAVLTDAGRLVLLDASLGTALAVPMPEGTYFCGCTDSGGRGIGAAWTRAGDLFAISSRGGAEKVAGDGVVLACSPHLASGAIQVVRWDKERGACFEVMSLP